MSTEIALQGCAFIAMLSVISCVLMANRAQFYKRRMEFWFNETIRWRQALKMSLEKREKKEKPDPADWWKS